MEGVRFKLCCYSPPPLTLEFFAQKTYINDQNTDNNWNTKWFYQAPVSAQQVPTRSTMNDTARPWDLVLHDYLREIDALPALRSLDRGD
jgi:hypothetical protein